MEVANDADFEARAGDRSVAIEHADPCMVNGFEELLRSAIENVARNAIRHTAEGTAVEISLQTHNSRVSLRVRDYGPGVPETMLSDVFLPFRRIANGDSEGAGSGLAIAERAVHVHRGTIRAMNAPVGGLIVEIDLPIAWFFSSGKLLRRLSKRRRKAGNLPAISASRRNPLGRATPGPPIWQVTGPGSPVLGDRRRMAGGDAPTQSGTPLGPVSEWAASRPDRQGPNALPGRPAWTKPKKSFTMPLPDWRALDGRSSPPPSPPGHRVPPAGLDGPIASLLHIYV